MHKHRRRSGENTAHFPLNKIGYIASIFLPLSVLYLENQSVMPASLISDMNSQGSGLEDQRALQIALELTKLGLNENERGNSVSARSFQESPNSELKKSASTSSSGMCAEDVEVPSCDHVAEIVGRQGCKIKALRAKTNTYIKTPVRGEPSVFQVTGKKEDVEAAKREILSAAEHFTQIRASRGRNSSSHGPPSPSTPGQETILVRVPYRVVGLVVGPKGATIKRIQQQTQTYIVTPSRDKEPIFEVTGLPESVEKARQEILTHIALRTGEGLGDGPGLSNNNNNVSHRPNGAMLGLDEHGDFQTNGIDHDLHEINGDLMSSIYKPPSVNSAFTSYANAINTSNTLMHAQHQQHQHPDNIFAYPSVLTNSTKLAADLSGITALTSPPGLYDSDEGIGSSPSFDGNPMVPLSGGSIWSDLGNDLMTSSAGLACLTESLTSSVATTLSPSDLAQLDNMASHCSVRRMGTEQPMASMAVNSVYCMRPMQVGNNARGSASTSPTDSTESIGNQRRSYMGGLDNEMSPW